MRSDLRQKLLTGMKGIRGIIKARESSFVISGRVKAIPVTIKAIFFTTESQRSLRNPGLGESMVILKTMLFTTETLRQGGKRRKSKPEKTATKVIPGRAIIQSIPNSSPPLRGGDWGEGEINARTRNPVVLL